MPKPPSNTEIFKKGLWQDNPVKPFRKFKILTLCHFLAFLSQAIFGI